ncbi:hypothetical protein DINM_005987 [Dirofilaria immitis]|nr:hypothetical protein [Dirofilaria immitis]
MELSISKLATLSDHHHLRLTLTKVVSLSETENNFDDSYAVHINWSTSNGSVQCSHSTAAIHRLLKRTVSSQGWLKRHKLQQPNANFVISNNFPGANPLVDIGRHVFCSDF